MLENVESFVNQGYISKRKHPTHDLYILNYTPKTQYEGFWNELTMQCRGLIIDSNYNIKSRCFNKFFNLEEVRNEVYSRLEAGLGFSLNEKIDGSLGILYWINNEPFIATRGSFESKQSLVANKILKKYNTDKLKPEVTYLFEIVYPENKICVDYGKEQKLVLLATIETFSGQEIQIETPFEKASCFDLGSDFLEIKKLNLPNKEGFVVRFEDGYRFKIKFEDYVKMHSLLFSLSSKTIWNNLRSNTPINIENLPDETYNWVKKVKKDIEESFRTIEQDSIKVFKSIQHLDRKEFAQVAKQYKNSSVLFKMLDNKPYKDIIWKIVEPDYRTPNEEI